MCGPSGYLWLVDAPSVYGEYTLYDEDMSVYSEFTLYNEDMYASTETGIGVGGPLLVE
jgi:hypothetical protein